ncbi:lasso peptide biosynthesis B2 protein [Aestuariibacter sp. A3R04]|uniref:lasso peptide biosynthesis B2 protein n=1 Tax=Aestuariibacter sp. A3R04 TaxID=2841571 RepID=UPI001C097FB3|nr:lasso peptide biosynthesis B2 protein [Aestuariibacter sp. A3R04]MBU3020905.1 lasso peptide biosynthesis B2 protein [Aestuariibacter sp. A3R04]
MLAFFRLTATQKKWFLKAWIAFFWWHIRIRFTSYQQWQHRVFPTVEDDSNNTCPADFIAIIEKAGRHHLWHMNCLRRCLVTMEMLHHINVFPAIHFGVKIEDGATKAHCWLSLNGTLINDSEEVVSSYTELRANNASVLFTGLS